jgi:hypothetical protein
MKFSGILKQFCRSSIPEVFFGTTHSFRVEVDATYEGTFENPDGTLFLGSVSISAEGNVELPDEIQLQVEEFSRNS